MFFNKVICTIYGNGDKEYRLNSLLHRVDGPAVERANGTKGYYLYGQSFDASQAWQQAQDRIAHGQIYYYHPATQDWIKILHVSGYSLLGISEKKYYSDSWKVKKLYLSNNTCCQRLSLTTTMYLQHQDQLVWVDKVSLLQLQALPFPEPLEFKLFQSQLR